MARRAGDFRRGVVGFLGLPDCFHLFLGKRLEIIHERSIVIHLFQCRHAGKAGQEAVEGSRKADGPGSIGSPGVHFIKNLLHSGRGIGQLAALNRLHDDELFPVLPDKLVVLPGADRRAFPVGVIDLQLDEFHFRVFLQKLLQKLGLVMEGKADMPDGAGLFLLLDEVPEMKLLIALVIIRLNRMQEIVVEILRPGPLQ